MDKRYFLELLRKYLQGEATNEEHQFLLSYYNLFQSEPDVLALLTSEKKEELKSQMYATIWKNISREEQSHGKVKPMRKWLIRMSAAAVFLLSVPLEYFFSATSLLKNKPCRTNY